MRSPLVYLLPFSRSRGTNALRAASYRVSSSLPSPLLSSLPSPPTIRVAKIGIGARRHFSSCTNEVSTPETDIQVKKDEGPTLMERLQSAENRSWYWENRDSIMRTYKGKKIAIENKRIIASSNTEQEMNDILSARGLPGKDVITTVRVGDEYAVPVVISASGVKPSDVLVSVDDIVFPNKNEFRPVSSYAPDAHFYGPNDRLWVTLPVRVGVADGTILPMSFILDTGAPFSSAMLELWDLVNTSANYKRDVIPLSNWFRRFYVRGRRKINEWITNSQDLTLGNPKTVFIFGEEIQLYVSRAHFANINVLGTDLLWKLRVVIDRQNNTISLEHPKYLAGGAERTGAVQPITATNTPSIPSQAVQKAWEKIAGVSLRHHYHNKK